MSHVRCIFSASKDMTINIKLFPIYSNSYGHAYDAMFAHDIAATFPSDRVRVCVANFVDRARCMRPFRLSAATFASDRVRVCGEFRPQS